MILLDTHIWVWLVSASPPLNPQLIQLIEKHQAAGLGVSIISCWEVAKLVEKGRLTLNRPVGDWISAALSYPHVTLLPLTPEIIVDSTQLPVGFHTDPADQMIVATSRILGLPLLTVDSKILAYPHVSLVQ